jgi:superfamily II DNA or RNA helicase
MNFKDFKIEISYLNKGENGLSKIINPLLEHSKTYRRSVGYFDSSSFDFIGDSLKKLVDNGGSIKLITSPKLTKEDIDAIKLGLKYKKDLVGERFSEEFENSIRLLSDENLKLISKLIADGTLEVMIVTSNNGGMYHDKLAILEDYNGNFVVFTGSNNETYSGYGVNYEKIRVFKSWTDLERVIDEINEFERIWSKSNLYLETYDFQEAIKKRILVEIEKRNLNPENNKKILKNFDDLFEYQKEAVIALRNNNYSGFLTMATGTGKTFTTIAALKELLEKNVLAVIAVPYKHLIHQWSEEIGEFIDDATFIYVSSENTNWENDLANSLLFKKIKIEKKIIIITTIISFFKERFQETLDIYPGEKLLVVDEAHNFVNRISDVEIKNKFHYKIGLSATPYFGSNLEKKENLLNYFYGGVYEYEIDKAIGVNLVNYDYNMLFLSTTENDERDFKNLTRQMASCYKDNKLIDQEKFQVLRMSRLRVLSMAENKVTGIDGFIDLMKNDDHFIVYCSDGKVNDEKHLQSVVKKLNEKGIKPSQFTAKENINERISLIENFNAGYINTLVAIRCLDEGINIPSIKSALILSSNDSYREFVQRRGRILRKYQGKIKAKIYDIIILPTLENKQIAEIELRRAYEYSRLSLNSKSNIEIIKSYADYYNINLDDLKFNNDVYISEETTDE